MKIINLIQQTNILKRNLNKNNLFLSSVKKFSGVRCGYQGGLWCSVRKYHDVEYENNYQFKIEKKKTRRNKKSL